MNTTLKTIKDDNGIHSQLSRSEASDLMNILESSKNTLNKLTVSGEWQTDGSIEHKTYFGKTGSFKFIIFTDHVFASFTTK